MAPSIETLVQQVRAMDTGPLRTRAAARLMSILESEPQRLPGLFRVLPGNDWPQPSVILGITGSPGSGKSTLVDALVREFRARYPDRMVGIIAVDPSSPFTGGAVLGDRVRMMRHASDPMVFIRSLASRGHLGGLSLGVKGVLRVMGLLGCDVVFIETVGVGQNEVEVAGVADRVLVVVAPGHGDAIQLLKAGLLEIGDLFAVNKFDTDGAHELLNLLVSTLKMSAGTRPREADSSGEGTDPERLVYPVSSISSTGIGELADAVEQLKSGADPGLTAKRREAVLGEVKEAVLEEARVRLLNLLESNDTIREALTSVGEGARTAEDVAGSLLAAAAEETSN